jgi:UDP-2-acetamido-3-amino-2,3-dideoxy-glucuronate N-acetyltransferase
VSGAVRLGVAGAGPWGRNIVRTARELGVLAAVCDGDIAALDAARDAGGPASYFSDYSKMLAEGGIEAVAIAAPAPLHADLAIAAIDAGLAVLVEKPFATSLRAAERVVERARARGTPLAAGHLLLYDGAVRAILHCAARGDIGSVRHVRTRRLGWGRLRAHEDVWWSFAPHDVSVVLAVMGDDPLQAACEKSAFVRPHVADMAYADFQFPLGRSAHVEVSWIEPQRAAQIDVVGSEGVLSLIDERNGSRCVRLWPCGDRLNARGEPELWREELRMLDFDRTPPLRAEIAAFCDAVRHGTPLPSGADEALAVVRALEMVQRPIREEVAG